jgi:cell division protein FtsW
MIEGLATAAPPLMRRTPTHTATTSVRDRWRMGSEARALTLISAVLTAFGLAALYSASAFVAMSETGWSAYFLTSQIKGVGIGIFVFAVAAKFDADKLRRWAWPIMWFTIAAMLAVLVLPGRIAPTILWVAALSLRWVVSAVGVWKARRRRLVLDAHREEGRKSQAIQQGTRAVPRRDRRPRCACGARAGSLDRDAVHAPHGALLFVGGARLSHFIALAAMCLPLTLTKIEKWRYAFSA